MPRVFSQHTKKRISTLIIFILTQQGGFFNGQPKTRAKGKSYGVPTTTTSTETVMIGDVPFTPSTDIFIKSTGQEAMEQDVQTAFIQSLIKHSKGITIASDRKSFSYDFTLVPLPEGYTWNIDVGCTLMSGKYGNWKVTSDKPSGTIESKPDPTLMAVHRRGERRAAEPGHQCCGLWLMLLAASNKRVS